MSLNRLRKSKGCCVADYPGAWEYCKIVFKYPIINIQFPTYNFQGRIKNLQLERIKTRKHFNINLCFMFRCARLGMKIYDNRYILSKKRSYNRLIYRILLSILSLASKVSKPLFTELTGMGFSIYISCRACGPSFS